MKGRRVTIFDSVNEPDPDRPGFKRKVKKARKEKSYFWRFSPGQDRTRVIVLHETGFTEEFEMGRVKFDIDAIREAGGK